VITQKKAIAGLLLFGLLWGQAGAVENIALSLVPVGAGSVTGNDLVIVEVFISAGTADQPFRGTQVDLPCSLLGGASGTVTTGSADSDGASTVSVNVAGGSQAGVPYLYPGGVAAANQAFCRAAGTPAIGVTEPVILAAGQTRYLATFVYRVSDCAVGDFDLLFEGRSVPPMSNDSTRLIAPDGPDPDSLDDVIPFKAGRVAVSVDAGRCCRGSFCLGELNRHCCLAVREGILWEQDTTCDAGCPPCSTDEDCDDDDVCTADSCREGTCEYVPQEGSCNDGLFCTQTDRCIKGRCEGSGTPCPGQRCHEARDTCVACLVNADCDDGLFCNGAERCTGMGTCIPGPEPCFAGPICDEELDRCLECDSNADCSDGDVCTTDSCVEGLCVHGPAPNGIACNDRLFCTVIDACADGACIGTGDRCPGRACHEDRDVCVECLVDADCDDDNVCTFEGCNLMTSVCFRGTNTEPCDDGLFCTVDDQCADGVCTGSPRPCPGGALCDEKANQCPQCLTNAECNDNNDCTSDSCHAGICAHDPEPNGQPCDDGLFCTLEAVCRDGLCVGLTGPCPPDRRCDEAQDMCVAENLALTFVHIGGSSVTGGHHVTVEVFITAHLADQVLRGLQVEVPCSLSGGLAGGITTGTADADPASILSVNTTEGSSGGIPFLFPGGLAPVNQNSCRAAATPAISGSPEVLFAGQTRYVATIVYAVSDCAAGDFGLKLEDFSDPPQLSDSTRVQAPDGPDADAIDDLVPFVAGTSVLSLDVGRCCRGAECLGELNEHCCLEVQGGGNWLGGASCEDRCECAADLDCDDDNPCTTEVCVRGKCVYSSNSLPCDDGRFCTAVDTCRDGKCIGTGNPCASEENPFCDELLGHCVECLRHVDCDDGHPCTTDRCDTTVGICLHANNSKPCDDGLYCTKPDRCVNGVCVGVGRRCPGRECDEAADRCLP